MIGLDSYSRKVFNYLDTILIYISLCKREHVESNVLNNWKLNILKIIDKSISFYSNIPDLLSPKPKFSFRYFKQDIQEFHRKCVLGLQIKYQDIRTYF